MPEPVSEHERQRLSEMRRVKAAWQPNRVTHPFAVRVLAALLWLTVVSGVVASVLVPTLLLTRGGELRLTLPVEVRTSGPHLRLQSGPLKLSVTSPALPRGAAAFQVTQGQYSVPAARLGTAGEGFILLVSSALLLAWTYAAWLLLGIVQSLPQPFTLRNARRLVSVAWLGVAINLTNSLVGTVLGFWVIEQAAGGSIPGLDPKVTGTPTIAFGQALDPSLQVPWIMVLSAFVLALVFRIGVQQRENEVRLLAEQELTV